jgi:hypothetical protein
MLTLFKIISVLICLLCFISFVFGGVWTINQDVKKIDGVYGDWRLSTNLHTGVDLPGSDTSLVYSFTSGKVMKVWSDQVSISIESEPGYLYVYAHIIPIVQKDQIVNEGELIAKGLVGGTYRHLHFAKMKDVGELRPVDNPLKSSILGSFYQDNTNPVIVSIEPATNKHFYLRTDDCGNCDIDYKEVDYNKTPLVIHGNVDIIVNAYDLKFSYSSLENKGGIFAIGYAIKNEQTKEYYKGRGESNPIWLILFKGQLWPNDQAGTSQEMRDILYDSNRPNDQHNFYYIVTNSLFYTEYGIDHDVGDGDADGISKEGGWNTNQLKGGYREKYAESND